MIVNYLNRVKVVVMVVVAIYVGFIGFKMGANRGRAQMGVDTISLLANHLRATPNSVCWRMRPSTWQNGARSAAGSFLDNRA